MVAKEYRESIEASGMEIAVLSTGGDDDFLSLTDIAKKRDSENPRYIIQNWMRTRNTIEFLGVWETLYNENFNRVEFEAFKNSSGSNSFVMTPQKWINATKSIGIKSKSGRYGGTYAHKDIALEFASWISPEFKLYILKDYQRLKENENSRISTEWNIRRVLSSTNYKIHTDAIKDCLVDETLPKKYQGYQYASEADMLNVVVFGRTAKEWREANKDKIGNIRDFASVEQLIVLANLEGINAKLVRDGLSENERAIELRKTAASQLKSLLNNPSVKKLK